MMRVQSGRASPRYGQPTMVRLWDPETGQPIGNPLETRADIGQTAVVFSPDGRRLAVSNGWDRMVRLWDTDNGERKADPRPHRRRDRCGVQSRRAQLATASGDGTIRMWDSATGQSSVHPSKATPTT